MILLASGSAFASKAQVVDVSNVGGAYRFRALLKERHHSFAKRRLKFRQPYEHAPEMRGPS
jgi:hypothetical protein